MRIAALVAIPMLVVGCSHTVGGTGQPQTSSGQPSSAAPTSPSSSKPSTAASAPASGAPIAAVIAWIEAAHPADPRRYKLDADIAFSAPASKTRCTTDAKHTAGLLSCLVELGSPPPRPDTAYGEWKGGWVDFDGTDLQVGSARADPGPFLAGTGAELALGDSLAFGDFRCRADQAGLFCVNYAHQSAVRFSPTGVEPFGCLRSVPPPDGVGVAFNCP
ncbi:MULTISPECIES: hypothetical protein [Mycobacterium]|uniref:LppI n=1 Tax=Mycobacterium kiyosense TaxID=2871094 RepID=A0A9P3Q3J8_9MYCO|nr:MULTISPECIES: hypothetical protein [Mycobacterium]BDE14415.1 hypothetical protein MKCMC460_32750 [Mycobacterium sp. 20KCMC460]GLB83241.1 hypothetical protein SRL2020028_24970 [Mycobacterium kiyosense]GLB91255.1 hypothetical protein SRL2020130_40720 [Mycobacterium kiyosense]GLB97857.1 hypothetical protein SRL2020226_46330 [Mycobacterium kiyosense]GLC03080.1 hypothetical protein SRL2020400_36710 [Mycobacterium kiyosense]